MVMKKSSELVRQVSREIIQEGINLEMDWNWGDVNGERCIIEEDYAYVGSGRYDGVDGEILNLHGFEVISFQPWEMEHDGDRFHRASVSFYKK